MLPRPGDASKWLIAPVGFGLGAVAVGGFDRETLVRAAVVWVLLELLVYQARYQYNDVRGFVADQMHPEKVARGRLPGPLDARRSRVATSGSVAAAKVALAFGVALALPGLRLVAPVALTTVAVFGVAAGYELLKARATGYSDEIPPPVNGAVVALWVAVGAGYAVRGLTGLLLAVDMSPAHAVVAATSLWAFGVAFVTSRWALEATAFGRWEQDRLTWHASADHGREHSTSLVRWLPTSVDLRDWSATKSALGDGPLDGWRAVRSQTSLRAPWNVAAVVAGASAALTGSLLVERTVTPRHRAEATMAGGLTSIGVVAAGRSRWMVGISGVPVLAAALAFAEVRRPWAAVLPWAAATAAQVSYTGQCADDLGRPFRAVGQALRVLRRRMPQGRGLVPST